MATDLEAARDVVCECVGQVNYLRECAELAPMWERFAPDEIVILGKRVTEAEARIESVGELLRGRMATPKIDDVYGASCHDLAINLARRAYEGMWFNADAIGHTFAHLFDGEFDPEQVEQASAEEDDAELAGGLAGARQYMLRRCPAFNRDEIVEAVKAESAIAIRETQPAIVGAVGVVDPPKPAYTTDTETDKTKKTEKKTRKRHRMDQDAWDCAEKFMQERRDDPSLQLKTFVRMFAKERSITESTLYKRLTDNRKQWDDADM